MAKDQRYFVSLEFHGTKYYSIEKIHKFLYEILNPFENYEEVKVDIND